jgi:hypothetical protein
MPEGDRQLSSAEVARILRRASQLAGADEVADGISERALIAAAEEVGIPAAAVNRSIALERLGGPPAHHPGDVLVGPEAVVVDVELPMGVEEALGRLDAWLVTGHHLRRERLTGDAGEWAQRDGVLAGAARTIRSAMGEGRLGELSQITAVARRAQHGCVMRVTIDRHGSRAGWMAGSTAVAAVGTAGVVAGAVLLAPVVLVVAPVALGAGVVVARGGRSQSARLDRELRRVLDAVDRRIPPTPLRKELWPMHRRRIGRAPRP